MSDGTIREFAPAKVNLFLHVGDKRSDGFHALESLVAFTSVGDALSFEPAEDLTLKIEGPFARALESDATNLVLRAARALASEIGIAPRASMVLTKNLPLSSGIGGGSADAAATLRGLETLWRKDLPQSTREKIAVALGSDVPVCLSSSPSWMEGRGERLSHAPAMPSFAVLLVNPAVAVPTRSVFAALRERSGAAGATRAVWSSANDLIGFLQTTRNDLEGPACAIAPVIAHVLQALSASAGVRLARMSGSGATCFGLFDGKETAMLAARRIADSHRDWWIAPARLL